MINPGYTCNLVNCYLNFELHILHKMYNLCNNKIYADESAHRATHNFIWKILLHCWVFYLWPTLFFIRLGCFFMTCTRRMNDFLDGDEPKWNMNTHNTHVRGYELRGMVLKNTDNYIWILQLGKLNALDQTTLAYQVTNISTWNINRGC